MNIYKIDLMELLIDLLGRMKYFKNTYYCNCVIFFFANLAASFIQFSLILAAEIFSFILFSCSVLVTTPTPFDKAQLKAI